MKILYLGPERPEFVEFLRSFDDEVITTSDPLTGDSELLEGVDFLVSYGYRHILRADVLDRFGEKAINLHISLLPWNRGADPNLWSWLKNTPKGVTIHVLDEGVDTGPILAQERMEIPKEGTTLRSSYELLTQKIERLFRQVWPVIRGGHRSTKPQLLGGTLQRVRDKEPYMHLLTEGWDTPVSKLSGKGVSKRAAQMGISTKDILEKGLGAFKQDKIH